MNLSEKLKHSVCDIQRYRAYHGVLHHMELEGEISNHMTYNDQEYIVWCVNDYLGLMNNPESKRLASTTTLKYGAAYPHATRATFGERKHHRTFERELADFSQMDSAFLLNLGYAGIASIIDALTDRHDTIIYDQNIHACSIDGVRMHNGRKFAFKHNSINHLELQLQRALKRHNPKLGGILLIIDGVYSMHGEQAPLEAIAELKKKYGFCLLVDDSHGFGVLGENGRGTPEAHGIQDSVDIYISTFTKALGTLGAFVAGNKTIIDYLRYNIRSQIFSRTMPQSQILPALNNLAILRAEPQRRQKLWKNTHRFQNGLKALNINIGQPESPITPIRINGSLEDGLKILFGLREHGVFSYIVSYPIVEKGTCLIRMVPTYNHSTEDIDQTLYAFKKLKEKYPVFLSAKKQLEYRGQEPFIVPATASIRQGSR